MGWDEFRASKWKHGQIDRKAEVDNYLTWFKYDETKQPSKMVKSVTVAKSRMVGSTYYGAINVWTNKDGVISNEYVGVVVLTKTRYSHISIKVMEETMGPCYYDCPKSILDMLTPTMNELAIEWRAKCYKKADSPKGKIGKLKVGSVISFPAPFDTRAGHKEGETVKLYKYRRGHWQVQGTSWGWRQQSIPDQFTVEVAAQ